MPLANFPNQCLSSSFYVPLLGGMAVWSWQMVVVPDSDPCGQRYVHHALTVHDICHVMIGGYLPRPPPEKSIIT